MRAIVEFKKVGKTWTQEVVSKFTKRQDAEKRLLAMGAKMSKFSVDGRDWYLRERGRQDLRYFMVV